MSDDLDWNRLRVFLAAAEHGSLSGAARALGLTQPTVGRQVDALERALGLTLIERVGRGIELTPAGKEVRAEAQHMKASADRLGLIAEARSATLEGTVRVTASEVVAVYLLPEVFLRIHQRHPRLRIEVVASNDPQDLQRREADIALRNFMPHEPELIVRKLPEREGYLYASTDWVTNKGLPTTPEALAKADFLAFQDVPAMVALLQGVGVPVDETSFYLASDCQVLQWEMSRRGYGIAVMMAEIGDRDPRMVRILPEVVRFPVPVYLTCHRELKTSARIRAVFDALAEGWSKVCAEKEAP